MVARSSAGSEPAMVMVSGSSCNRSSAKARFTTVETERFPAGITSGKSGTAA